MSKAKVYETLPYDLSGSRSKNRFRNELMWGLEKLYEIYRTGEDFCIIFDYVCDIEIHFINRFEFYQIKTSNKGEAYTIGKISNPDKQGNSILGKVYILKNIIDASKLLDATIIAIVVNVPLKTLDDTVHSSVKKLNLNDIKDTKEAKRVADRNNGDIENQSKNKIVENLKLEIKTDTIDLSNAYYINSSLDLINPDNTLLGITLKFIEEITGKEASRASTLYRTLKDVITDKACYELKCETYPEVEKYKGITKTEFEFILDRCISISEDYVKEAKYIIENNYHGFSEKIKLIKGLSFIVTELNGNVILNNLKEKIMNYINDNIDELNDAVRETIDSISQVFNKEFPIEYSSHERIALVILMVAKYKED
ncbi:dsDNA nuclease domain-containing protein [Clostridium beijerinckii]|uniref:dsDNA nuclease domain-containing protein n=1 Tax=Clostridium beijerinckii TaxID=1520 RepID=UPI0003D2E023|nr:dsDNA nuclease domain-containing protein [Clostridium beijerinckii]ALB46197.1 DUF4297 domain-containing protein [Clostridium beijerinckii NRRL B-598]